MGKGDNRKSQKMINRRGQAKKKLRLRKLIESRRATKRTSSSTAPSKPTTRTKSQQSS